MPSNASDNAHAGSTARADDAWAQEMRTTFDREEMSNFFDAFEPLENPLFDEMMELTAACS